MQLDLDTDVLKVRDQSNKEALTDQYPGINILTKESREKLEKLEIDKNRRYDELINNLTFSVNNEQLPKELVRLKMSELNIFNIYGKCRTSFCIESWEEEKICTLILHYK